MKSNRVLARFLIALSMIAACAIPSAAASGQSGDAAAEAAAAKAGCDQGDAGACNNLAVYYENGQGVPRNDGMAVELYKRACSGGYADACRWMGTRYAQGTGVPKNGREAAAFYQRACDLGNMEGCRGAGIMYAVGQDVDQDFGHAAALFDHGCSGGDADSCRLAQMARRDGAASQSDDGGGSGGGGSAPASQASANGDVFGQCVRLQDLGQSGIQHMWQLRNVCNATIKVVYCFQETFAAAGDTNMCADRVYDHRTIASGSTFDFPFSPLPEGTALSDGRVVRNNQFRVMGFACANGSMPDVYFDNGRFLFQHC